MGGGGGGGMESKRVFKIPVQIGLISYTHVRFFPPFTETKGKTLFISGKGIDSRDCGQSTPCHTVGFVLANRAAIVTLSKIENSQFSEHFTIKRTFSIPRNITLQGVHGQPVISIETPFQPGYLFEDNEIQKVKNITLRITNLYFKPIQAGGAHCAPLQVFPCCAKTVYSSVMKLSDF